MLNEKKKKKMETSEKKKKMETNEKKKKMQILKKSWLSSVTIVTLMVALTPRWF